MKTKSLYIYLGAVVIILAAILIYNSASDKPAEVSTETPGNNMPNDDVHKGLSDDVPNKSNVRGDFMERYTELKNKYAENPKDTTVAKEYAIMLSQAHRKGQAIEIYENILSMDATRADVILMLGYEYFETNDLVKAEEMTRKVLSIKKDNSQAQFNLGAILMAKGKPDEAKKIWKEIIKKYPGSEAATVAKKALDKMSEKTQTNL